MSTYNGHKSWNYWNVALWIANDESLYREALATIRHSKNRDEAARTFLDTLEISGLTKTPDGAPFTFSAVRAAMAGLV